MPTNSAGRLNTRFRSALQFSGVLTVLISGSVSAQSYHGHYENKRVVYQRQNGMQNPAATYLDGSHSASAVNDFAATSALPACNQSPYLKTPGDWRGSGKRSAPLQARSNQAAVPGMLPPCNQSPYLKTPGDWGASGKRSGGVPSSWQSAAVPGMLPACNQSPYLKTPGDWGASGKRVYPTVSTMPQTYQVQGPAVLRYNSYNQPRH